MYNLGNTHSLSKIIPNPKPLFLFWSYYKELPLHSALLLALPFVLPVAFPWMLPALSLGSPLAALLRPCPSPAFFIPLPLSITSIHRKAWRIRQAVHSWLHRELGLKTKFRVYFWGSCRLRKCCKDRRVSLMYSLCLPHTRLPWTGELMCH